MLVQCLVEWALKQSRVDLPLATKINWSKYKHVADDSQPTSYQKTERLAYERCGFIFSMYERAHAQTDHNGCAGWLLHSRSHTFFVQYQETVSLDSTADLLKCILPYGV